MNLSKLFTGRSRVENHVDENGGGAQSKYVRMAGLNRQIRSLVPGQTIRGEIVSRNGSEVQVRLSDDMVMNARVDQSVHLEVGKTVTFEVKSNGGTLSLSPLFTNIAADANVLKALDMAGLPVNDVSVAMTEQLMKAGLPVNRNSLLQVYREINSFPEAGGAAQGRVADVVNLHRLQLPVNEANMQQIEAYRNLTYQLVKGLTSVSDALPGAADAMLEAGNDGAAAGLYRELFNMIQEGLQENAAGAGFQGSGGAAGSAGMEGVPGSTPGGAAASGGANGAQGGTGVPGVPDGTQGSISAAGSPGAAGSAGMEGVPGGASGEANAPGGASGAQGGTGVPGVPDGTQGSISAAGSSGAAGSAGMEGVPGGASGEANAPGGASGVQGGTNVPGGLSGAPSGATASGEANGAQGGAGTPGVPDGMQGSISAARSPGAAGSAGAVSGAPGSALSGLQGGSLSLSAETRAALADKMIQAVGGLRLPAEEAAPLLESAASFGRGELPADGFFRTAARMLDAAAHMEGGIRQLQKLFSGKEFQRALAAQLKEIWTLAPEEVSRSGKVEELYRRMDRQLKSLLQTLEAGGQGGGTAYRAAANLSRNIDFMNQLNHLYAYVQLPLRLHRSQAHGDLYVYTNKKSLADHKGQISALLHLDMERLGPVDVYVTLQETKVSTKFYVADESILDFMEEHMDLLTARLQKRGYSCSVSASVRESNEKQDGGGLAPLLQQEKNVLLSQYAFDVRT